jgi:hypothetical protein
MVAVVCVEGNNLENVTLVTIWVRVEDDPHLLAHKTILAIDNEALIALPGFSASAVAQHPRRVTHRSTGRLA